MYITLYDFFLKRSCDNVIVAYCESQRAAPLGSFWGPIFLGPKRFGRKPEALQILYVIKQVVHAHTFGGSLRLLGD